MSFRFRRRFVDHDEIIEHFRGRRDIFGRSVDMLKWLTAISNIAERNDLHR
jgi:hypothetical protein